MKVKVPVIILALVFSLGLAGSGFALTYQPYGDNWLDAEKSPNNSEDDLMCWAAAASNILAWSGWGSPVAGGAGAEDTIFAYFQDHWTDVGGLMEFGWDWWFDGTNPSQGWSGWSQVDVAGGGFYNPPYFTDYYYRTSTDSAAMSAIDDYLHAGYGVTLAIYGAFDHAITCWGYEYDALGNYLGVYVTDSDDDKIDPTPDDELKYYNVSYNTSTNQWDLGGSLSGCHIGEVMALDQAPTSAVPLPAAV
ncbi:MAG: IdeS/Mac family cysteine endopeptidase, partial [Thermodesulfobacteriota bacterium]|nr:IdeS/Mac family cysteine endopeptidase [Thermodesulfobacteriota bacterium]